ncbi:iron uptake transporter permease EfeU [Telmatospirillum siberiense]|uniref:Iron transporter n=1 Tax=Telmatospirillum siberiense TaxID=382514 RepID=A0A2N3Q1X7_9PROT|nr:iron uptake transporter permease EfeU [Telmatospirillum siberiense]PKU26649.1 iron transporter [Telmatospirillum siberiense]
MLVPFLIMLREGLEAALIVGIVASYLKQTGRTQWLPAIWSGIGLACLLCLGIGLGLDLISAEFPQKQQEMFEAAVGLIAVGILTSMVFWMKKAGHSVKSQLHGAIDEALRPGARQGAALVGMVFFAVAREGLEAVFFLLAVFQQSSGSGPVIGAAAGLLAAAATGYGLYYGGMRLNLRLFFRITGLFILVVAAGLLSGSVRALHEAGLWNGLQATAFDLSAVLPNDSAIGSVLTGLFGYQDTPSVGEVSAYILFLALSLPLFLSDARRPLIARPRSGT